MDFDFTSFLFGNLIDKNDLKEIILLCDLTTDEKLD